MPIKSMTRHGAILFKRTTEEVEAKKMKKDYSALKEENSLLGERLGKLEKKFAKLEKKSKAGGE